MTFYRLQPVKLDIALTDAGQPDMIEAMVPDIWVYREADRLITKHGAKALNAVDRLVNTALDCRDADQVLLTSRPVCLSAATGTGERTVALIA